MHPKNIHSNLYDFEKLQSVHSELVKFIISNPNGIKTIDFSKAEAVFHLNKALLKAHYNLSDWTIPKGYLSPPIPGRADYIHHIADLLLDVDKGLTIKGLDVGVGANCIYSILGSQIYGWNMVGCDINKTAIEAALYNVKINEEELKGTIELRHQLDNANIFKGIIKKDEFFNFTMCNPPFHLSKENANKVAMQKLKHLKINVNSGLNFEGQANELWCNGGESLFIKRMIKQSVEFKLQVNWFTALVSKKEHLKKIYKQLDKLNTTHKTISMSHGNKKSRIVAWRFNH